MSAQPAYNESTMESDRKVSDALALLYKISAEDLESISQAKDALGMTFHEAALHTGLVSQRELDAAEEHVRRHARQEGRSIIAEALRRRPPARELVLWEGPKVRPGSEIILAHDPYHDRGESIRSLRTELLMRAHGQRTAGVFALVSSVAGEGRSLLAAELAIAFAQLGSRTLLVDADLRRPRQHLLFGAENIIGLAQSLLDGTPPRLYGVEGVPQMALLTSGTLPPNPLELLSGTQFERSLQEWRRSYEFIVLDTPPISRFSDGLAVASRAGNVVVLGRTNSTSFHDFSEMRRKLGTTNAWVIGAVMNNF
jgi:receptor protein-tyrosine kinase